MEADPSSRIVTHPTPADVPLKPRVDQLRTCYSVAGLAAIIVVLKVVPVSVAATVDEAYALPVFRVVVPAGEVRPTRAGARRLHTLNCGEKNRPGSESNPISAGGLITMATGGETHPGGRRR